MTIQKQREPLLLRLLSLNKCHFPLKKSKPLGEMADRKSKTGTVQDEPGTSSVQSLSHVQLCETPQTAAHQAPPSLGFSRQEHWSGLPFPSPKHESEK